MALRFSCGIACSVAFAMPLVAQPVQRPDRLPIESARRALREYAKRAAAHGVSGVLFVADGDSVLLNQAMGWKDPSLRVPNDTSTLFYIASLAKQFVAAAILRLEDDHRLRTSDSLATFFADVPADKRRITIDQLLAHSSGLGRYGFDAARRDWAVETEAQAVRGILQSPLTAAPGSRFDYQNTNYLLLGAIIERVAGISLDDFIERRLLLPAGARDTYFGRRLTPSLRHRVAWSLGDESESFTILDRTPTWLSHGRGVVTTASDLYRWINALRRGAVLSEASQRKLFAMRATVGPRYGYAAGWFVRVDTAGAPRVAFHGGDFRSYHSEVRVYPPSGRLFIALTNTSFRGRSITEAVLNQASDALRPAGDSLPAVAPRRSADVLPLAGEYVSPSGDALIVDARGTTLVVTPVGQRATDWIVLRDTAGAAARHRTGSETMALIGRLAHGGLEPPGAPQFLTPDVRQTLLEEWDTLTRTGGRLKSFQLLGTTRGDRESDVSIVRLKFHRDSLLYGIGWTKGAVAYTVLGVQNAVSPAIFAPSGNEWTSIDWSSGAVLRMSIDPARTSGARSTLTLHSGGGSIMYTRR